MSTPKSTPELGNHEDDTEPGFGPVVVIDWNPEKKIQVGPDPKDFEHLRSMPSYTTVFGWPEDKAASPYQVLEIQEVIKVLDSAGILCFLVGICALIYYGVPRIRDDWEVCVPSEKLDAAAALFRGNLCDQTYEPFPPSYESDFWDRSLLHSFPRFKLKCFRFFFYLIPSDDQHLVCEPINIELSGNNLPYPTLPVLAQSFVDTFDSLSLADLIDGMDLSEEWGQDNLNLSGTNDVDWAMKKNAALEAKSRAGGSIAEHAVSRKEIWYESAEARLTRGGPYRYPPDVYATRFRLHANEGEDVRSRTRSGC